MMKSLGKGLIHLTTDPKGSIIAQTMAPYPIFCCMLCHMWKWIQESDRKRVIKLHTFSEFILEIVNALVEQYASKRENESLKDCRSRCNESFTHIGKVAFHGLMIRKLAFNAEEFREIRDAMKTGCDIGVLSSQTKFADRDTRQRRDIEKIDEVSFPHKLMQEYLAGYYLATLYPENPSEFQDLLVKKVLVCYKEYRNILYFTAAHGKGHGEAGHAGRSLMEALCQTLMGNCMQTAESMESIESMYSMDSMYGTDSMYSTDSTEDKEGANVRFLVDVAFECHDERAIGPVIDFLRQVKSISLDATFLENQHTWLGFIYTLAACGQHQVTIYSFSNDAGP